MLTLDLSTDEKIFCVSVLDGSVFTIFAMRWFEKKLGLTQDRALDEHECTTESRRKDATSDNRETDNPDMPRVTDGQTEETRKRQNNIYP